MDKETLSNYGWIVICVLVLAVMIALAGPFGNFVADAVKSTTQGLFDVNQTALNSANVPGLTVDDQGFEDTNGDSNVETNTPLKFGEKYIITTNNTVAPSDYYLIFYTDGSAYEYGGGSETTIPAGTFTFTETELQSPMLTEEIKWLISNDGTTLTQTQNGEIQVILTLESAIQ